MQLVFECETLHVLSCQASAQLLSAGQSTAQPISILLVVAKSWRQLLKASLKRQKGAAASVASAREDSTDAAFPITHTF